MPGAGLNFLGGLTTGVGQTLSNLLKDRRQKQQFEEEKNLQEQNAVLGILGKALPLASDPTPVLGAMAKIVAGNLQAFTGKGGKGKKGKGDLLGQLSDPNNLTSLLTGLHGALSGGHGGGTGTPGTVVPIAPPSESGSGTPVGSSQTPDAAANAGPSGAPMPASGTAVPGGLGGIRLLTPAERERQKADITREEAVQRSAEEAQIKEGTTAYENAHPKPQTEPFLFKQNVDLFTQQHGRKPTTEETKKIGLDTHQQWTTSGRAPKPTLGPGAEDERTKQVLSRKGIDWEKATPEQIAQGRQQAAKELQAIEKQQLENQRLAAQAKQENLGINAGVSPTGHALPDVQLQADGRPDPTQQTTYLKAFPPEMARTIKALAEYRQSPTSITSRSAGGMNRQRILSYVQGYDPTYNDAMYDVRRRVITDWTSGKTRDAMRAANTVVGHLRDLNDAIKTLAPYKSSWFPGVQNKPRLALLKQTDPTVRDAIRQFDTARQAIAGELTTVYRGTGQGSNKDIEEWEKNADVNAATDDARQFVQTASDLMFSRINAAVSGYQASMGKLPDPGEALTPASVQQMQKLGIDISSLAVHPEAGAAAPASDQNPFRPKGGA